MKTTRTLPALLAAALLAGCASTGPSAPESNGRVVEAASARVAALPPAANKAFAFASPFSDHMVLQRGCPVPVWGAGTPGETVSVALFDGDRAVARADGATVGENGRWIAFLPPLRAGGPFSLRARRGATAPDGDAIAVEDVLVGDVWLCGGQSNMEMSFTWGVKDGEKELADADLPQVRLLHVQRAIDIEPRTAVAGRWTPCSAETARGFSACGFFFGRALQREIGVPVGLVEDCWSGTVAETWLSIERAAEVPGLENAVADRRRVIAEWKDGGPEKFQARHDAWQKSIDPIGEEAAAPDFAEGEGWEDATLPFSFEESIAKDYDGVVWVRRDFVLDAGQAAASNAVLALGMIDDTDVSFLNGTKVGRTDNWQTVRRYKVPDGLLREGTNTIAIRALDTGGVGGFHGGDKDVPRLEFGGAAPALSLAGSGWRRIVGASIAKNPEPKDPTNPGAFPNVPAACYNGMLSPLFPMAVRGAIWYQGCSNVGRHGQYRTLLPAVIGEWRDGFASPVADGAFPFYIVQLAAFMQTHPQPIDSGWAAMRWTQTRIGREVPNSGTVVAIDVGDHGDIHPKNKRAVGERLAALALAQTYGRTDQKLSPVPADETALASGKSMELRIRFVDPVSGKPAALKPGAVKGFQVSKNGKTFEWAEATAEGDTVTVGERSGDPILRVRYAWDDYPDCDLVSADGMPVGPFELSVGPAR